MLGLHCRYYNDDASNLTDSDLVEHYLSVGRPANRHGLYGRRHKGLRQHLSGDPSTHPCLHHDLFTKALSQYMFAVSYGGWRCHGGNCGGHARASTQHDEHVEDVRPETSEVFRGCGC